MASVQDIYNEIDRIEGAKGEIAEAIEEKGVAVPEEAKIEEYPGLVRQIRQGSEHAVEYVPQELTPEQQGQARENIGAGTYTKPNTGIPETDLAQGVQTLLEKANTAYQKPNGGIPKTDLATAVQNSLGKADTALQPASLTPITDLIPEQATPQNQLADKNFVNSSVATNTANYISDNGQPFQSVADLEAYTGTLTNNDYAFVVGTDAAGNTTYTRYKYNATTGEWAEEYVLNNSSFTAEQWAAISSGITALLVQKLSELPTEIVTYVAQTLTDAQKQQARTNIGATAPEIFWATYGVTTASEIDQAVAAGKVIFCFYNSYVYVYSGKGSIYYYFSCIYGGLQATQVRINVSTGAWSYTIMGIQLGANISQSVPTDRTSTTKYPSVKAVADALGKWGVVSQTQTWTGNNNTGYDYTMSNLVWGLIPQANIDLYVSAGAVFNETTGYFELNGLTDISYNEMGKIYSWYCQINGRNCVKTYVFFNGRTNLLPQWARLADREFSNQLDSNSATNMFCYAWDCEIAALLAAELAGPVIFSSVASFLLNAHKIRKIVGVFTITSSTSDNAFASSSLEDLRFTQLKYSISFKFSPRLNLASVVYMVEHAANTAAITITLHPTAFARCQADTTEYTYNGQTYTGIIAYAAAKNITIASA